MHDHRTRRTLIAALAVALLGPGPARGLKISDVTKLKGQRINRLSGIGLVFGLAGTGDGDSSAQAARGLQSFLEKFGAPVFPSDKLELRNIAIVSVSVTLPEHGVWEGDRVDVAVAAMGGAKSLAGGRLLLTPVLASPTALNRPPPAFAEGRIEVDAENPNVGRIREGAVMEDSVFHHYVAFGREVQADYERAAGRRDVLGLSGWIKPDAQYFTLIVDNDHASWAMAETIAKEIDDEYAEDPNAIQRRRLAVAVSPRHIVVELPSEEAAYPARFMREVEALPLVMPTREARVVINRKRGTIVMTGDVEISPVAITVKGLSITTVAPAAPEGLLGAVTGQPAVAAPAQTTTESFFSIDPNNEGGMNLANLIAALNQLKVATAQQIDVILEIKRAGALRAPLLTETD